MAFLRPLAAFVRFADVPPTFIPEKDLRQGASAALALAVALVPVGVTVFVLHPVMRGIMKPLIYAAAIPPVPSLFAIMPTARLAADLETPKAETLEFILGGRGTPRHATTP